jgi:hypothetical protein
VLCNVLDLSKIKHFRCIWIPLFRTVHVVVKEVSVSMDTWSYDSCKAIIVLTILHLRVSSVF